jgi:hypothetical protein
MSINPAEVTPEQFVVHIREDEVASDVMGDESLFSEMMYFVWCNELESKGGVPVSGKDDLMTTISTMEIGGIKVIRVIGMAKRS